MLVRLLPGADRTNARTALDEVYTDVFNLRAMNGLGLDHYLRWANTAARKLRSQISSEDIDRLVLTRRYWSLQSVTAETTVVLDLVITEIDERTRDLEDAKVALTEQIRRWSEPGIFVVCDTSVYIESPEKFESLDLAGPLAARGKAIHLIVPIIVIDELDNLKRASERMVRWRARYTLRELDKLFENRRDPRTLWRSGDSSPIDRGQPPLGDVFVEIVFDPPGHVRLPINDDEIIDRTLAIAALGGRPVSLLTYDTGQSTRGRALGLSVIKLSAPLEPEPTETNTGARRRRREGRTQTAPTAAVSGEGSSEALHTKP